MKKLITTGLAVCLLVGALVGCSSSSTKKENTASENTESIKTVRLIADPPAIAQAIRENKAIFEEKGYKLELIDVTDPIAMNQAVEEGSADANFFQHEIYLNQFNENNHGHIKVCGEKLYAQLVGIYSKKLKDVSEVSNGAMVAIQNDDTNRDRALKILEDAGLIKLKEDVQIANTLDIVENPKNLQFSEMVASNLIEALNDAELAVIPGGVIAKSGGNPEDNLGFYDRDDKGKYAVLMGVKEGNENEQWAKDLHDFLSSEVMQQRIKEELKGAWYPMSE